MDHDRERSCSINCPPFFDGEDYALWKVMMKVFLHSQDENIWNIVETGWEPPMLESKELKPRATWTAAEVRDHNDDIKARNCLFTALSKKEQKRIRTCKTAKEAWDLLQKTYEGNKMVRYVKLQMLEAEFETMTMADDESVDDFYARLMNVTDKSDSLGNPIAEGLIVKKFLRALPLSFHDQVTIIREVEDLNTYSLDELVANLQWYEMRIRPDRKGKPTALSVVRREEEKAREAVKQNGSDSEFTTEEFALMS